MLGSPAIEADVHGAPGTQAGHGSQRPAAASGPAPQAADATSVFSLVAYALVAKALTINNGFDEHLADLLTTGSVAAVGASLWLSRRTFRNTSALPAVAAWCVALGSTLSAFYFPPGIYVEAKASNQTYVVLSYGAVALVASFAIDLVLRAPTRPAIAAARRAMMFAVAFGLYAWMLRSSPAPRIDVWRIHQQGAAAVVHGHSPYAVGVIDAVDTGSFARRLDVYMYPPLNALMTAAAFAVTGETRWAQLVAILVGAACLGSLARRGSRNAALPDLLVACLLFHPRGLFVLEQGWGEPLALPFLGGFALAAKVGRFRLAAVLLGLLCALKQHFLLYLPALALVPGIGASGVLIALSTVVVTYVPFVLATPMGVWNGVVLHHLRNPFRGDSSLSLTAMLAHNGIVLPSWVGIAASLGSFGVLPVVPRKLGPLLMASSHTVWLFAAAALTEPIG
jgi:hypothetical protein